MNPFAFEPANSPLAELSAFAKAVFLIFVTLVAMQFQIVPLLVLVGAGFFLHFPMRVPLRSMRKTILFIVYLSCFSTAMRGIFPGDGRLFAPETLPASLVYALRLLAVFLYTHLYFASTKAAELGEYLTASARWISARIRKVRKTGSGHSGADGMVSDPGMMLSLSLLFLPRAFENYQKVSEAAKVRGYGLKKNKMRDLLAILQTFIFANIKSALITARAMEMRGYSNRRTIKPSRLVFADFALMGAGAGLYILSWTLR